MELHSASSPSGTIPRQSRYQAASLFVSLENRKAPPIPSIISSSVTQRLVYCPLFRSSQIFGCQSSNFSSLPASEPAGKVPIQNATNPSRFLCLRKPQAPAHARARGHYG